MNDYIYVYMLEWVNITLFDINKHYTCKPVNLINNSLMKYDTGYQWSAGDYFSGQVTLCYTYRERNKYLLPAV